MEIHALLLSDDLIDSSRVTAQGRAEGWNIKQVRSVSELMKHLEIEKPRMLLLDLQHSELDVSHLCQHLSLRPGKLRLLGFGSHVDTQRLKAARQAGFDQVMPRSQFFEQVRTHLSIWMNPASPEES